MAWTFDPATLATVPKDQVRLLVGDTDAGEQLVADEAITFLLAARGGDVALAAADVADRLQAYFSRQPDVDSGDESVDFSGRAERYAALAADMRRRADLSGGAPVLTGLLIADFDASRQDPSIVQPSFQHDLHETGADDPNDELRRPVT